MEEETTTFTINYKDYVLRCARIEEINRRINEFAEIPELSMGAPRLVRAERYRRVVERDLEEKKLLSEKVNLELKNLRCLVRAGLISDK